MSLATFIKQTAVVFIVPEKFTIASCAANAANLFGAGLKADKERIKKYLDNSLMLVTALSPKVGYDNAAKIANKAHKNGTTLKEESIKSGLITAKEYEKIVDPKKMISPY